jgi:hypothetical protein
MSLHPSSPAGGNPGPILNPKQAALKARLQQSLKHIGPEAFEDLYGSLQDLVRSDSEAKEVFAGFFKAIVASFYTDQVQLLQITAHELRRRVMLCIQLFRDMRGDCYWTLNRTLDTLPHALRVTLDGEVFEPKKERSTWAATDD